MVADGEDALKRRTGGGGRRGVGGLGEGELVHELQVEGDLIEERAGQFVQLLHEGRFGRRLDHEIELFLFPS